MGILILCLKVFIARIIDVTLATMRTVNNVKGRSMIAASIGVIEATIWFLIVKEALNVESSIFVALAFSFGFGVGTYIGGTLSKHLIPTKIQLQIVTSEKSDELIKRLREMGFAVTVVDVRESEFSEKKVMLFVEIDSKSMQSVKSAVTQIDEKSFIMVHESKEVHGGFFTTK